MNIDIEKEPRYVYKYFCHCKPFKHLQPTMNIDILLLLNIIDTRVTHVHVHVTGQY